MSDEILQSLPMRPLDRVELPRFQVPAGACDAHMHVFGPLERYPSVARPHYTLPDGKLSHYLGLMAVLGLQRFVIVQPSFYDTDNSCLLDALQTAGSIARGVVMIEPEAPEKELDRMHALGVRAIRLDLFKRSAWPLEQLRSFIRTMSERAAQRGWHLQFYTPGWLVRDLLDFLATLPGDFVIDHMGYMLEEDGLTDRDFARLLALMQQGRCWLKLSAPYRIAKARGYAAVAHLAQAIIRTAPHRAIWGSDWPHIPDSGRDTGELLNLLMSWAPEPGVRNRILVDNPQRLFGF
jgi:2-pyrone-4,6-dicarboxylate lactonase